MHDEPSTLEFCDRPKNENYGAQPEQVKAEQYENLATYPHVLRSSRIKNFTTIPEHLSVYQTSPKLWEREAFEEKLDGAPEATGEPGKFSAGELGRLTVRVFFSAGAGLLAWSHMPVETAQ